MIRSSGLSCLLSLLLLAGCGGPDAGAPERPVDAPAPAEPAGSAESTREMREAIVATAARRRQAEAAPSARRLLEPLPGGVLPDFEHQLVADMSNRTSVLMRQIGLQTRQTSASDAIERLAAQLRAAGLTVGQRSEHRGALTIAAWTPGGAPGHAAPSTGGDYINIVARDYEPGSDAARDGMVATLAISVYSP